MSAAIIQNNTNSTATTSTNSSRAIYFDCGDIFTTNKTAENLLPNCNLSNGHINGSNSMSELSMMDINCSNNSSMDQMDQMDQIQQQSQNKTFNHQFRFHAALTRTISTPQPQLKQHLFNQIQHHHQLQPQQQQQQQPKQHSPQQDSSTTATLVNTLIENLSNINLHRKLERTQSEPLPQQQQVNTSRYKTELCRPFEEAGECKYGEKCQFAHGYHELRNLQRHPKYKTEYCRTFHSVGFCPYGPRCHFVHNADEDRAQQQQQQQQQQQHQQQQLQQQTTKLQQNHSNYYPLSAKTSLKSGGGTINHSLPLSPPLSMSTGSDRESPTGSLSLSPTNSMTNFPFGEQISPTNSVFQTAFSYVNTPPESPNAHMSPVNTPPPTLMVGTTLPVYIKPAVTNSVAAPATPIPTKQLLHKSSSSPIAIIRGCNLANPTITSNTIKPPIKMNSVSTLNCSVTTEEARLPVFNRISSSSAVVDAFSSNAAAL